MKRLISTSVWLGFGIGGAIASQYITASAIAADASNDSIPPSLKKDRAALEALCARGSLTVKSNGEIDCINPSFTDKSECNIASVIYGSFTKPGVSEALFDINGCEDHASEWGGSALLRRSKGGWSLVRYEKGFRSNRCLKMTAKTGRNPLVCEGSHMGQGNLYNWLNYIQIETTKTNYTQLLGVYSNTGSGNPPYREVTIEDFAKKDINQDNQLDVLVSVSEAREPEDASDELGRESQLPSPKLHQLTFIFDGYTLRPTSQADILKRRVEYLPWYKKNGDEHFDRQEWQAAIDAYSEGIKNAASGDLYYNRALGRVIS